MRIAFVVTGGFDRSGRDRVIPSLLWLVERLARRHDIVVYVLRHYERPCRYSLAGATIQDLGGPQGLAAQYRALSTAVRADGPFDVVHGYWAIPAGLLSGALGRRLGVPSVVTCDSGEFVAIPAIGYGLQSSLRTRLAVALAVRLASRVTVCSQFQANLARERGTAVDVIPLGIDTDLFPEALRPSDGPPYRLLHVASLNRVKDQPTLLHALCHLTRSGVDATLDIVGEDTLSGGIAALARRLALSDRIRFHGFRPSGALSALYREAHLFVLSSLHEAAGVVLLEAAATGVPVVGPAVGYLADWSPRAATAVEPANPHQLANAIACLLQDRARCDRQASAAGRWARAHDADWTARTFEALYRDLSGGGTQ